MKIRLSKIRIKIHAKQSRNVNSFERLIFEKFLLLFFLEG